MARIAQRRSQNISGEFYVDTTCIDCDTCRWMAPKVFHRDEGQSAVYHQPETEAERSRSMQALLACPTASIGTVSNPKDIKEIQNDFPLLVAENVYHCGYHSEKSFGATSYFIRRSSGNILVDSPRFTPPLVKQLEAMGGIRYLYLTHRDDIADHQQFQAHFGCDRILHADEISNKTRDVEIQLTGFDPIELAPDLLVIPVPGHTKGHTVLLYNNKFLFAGDHLAYSDRVGHLIAFRRHCWYSWEELQRSMEKLQSYEFEWVLPGHGRRYHTNPKTMRSQLEVCLSWMEKQ